MGSLDAQDVASLDDCQAARTVKLLALSAASSRSSWRLSPSGSGTAVNCKPIRKAMGSTIRNISGAIRGVQVRGERAEQDAFRGEASLLPPWRVRWWSGHGLINEDSAPGLRGLP